MADLLIRPIASLFGRIRPPSDKSITHRSLLLAAAATSPSRVRNPLGSEDAEATERCLHQMGVRFEREGNDILVSPTEWQQPTGDLDCGNSGTTMRLLAGMIASRPLDVVMVGDASLSKRPMRRVAEPLNLMGAVVTGERPPLSVRGGSLKGIEYATPVASAQIKSAVLLAGLRAEGETWVSEPHPSRDHTERMLSALGVSLSQGPKGVGVHAATWDGFEIDVPGDISSAAFFMVAAALLPEARLEIVELSLNPTRTGILDVFRQCAIPVVAGVEREAMGEPVGACVVTSAEHLLPFEIDGELAPRLIDEIPVLAVLATQCSGVSRIRGARELRVKESDRIEVVATALRAMGAKVETFDDGLAIEGPTPLVGATIDAVGDHRIGMAFAIAGLIAQGETRITGAEAIATSFPDFEKTLHELSVI